MSANNEITINKKTFVIREVCVDSDYGDFIGKGKNLEEAITLAEKYMKNNEVEYGIHFVTK